METLSNLPVSNTTLGFYLVQYKSEYYSCPSEILWIWFQTTTVKYHNEASCNLIAGVILSLICKNHKIYEAQSNVQ